MKQYRKTHQLHTYSQTANSQILSGYFPLFYSQIFENRWCIAANYELLQAIFKYVLNQFSKHMGVVIFR